MAIDEDLERETMLHMGFTGEICPISGGVTFSIAYRGHGGHVMLGADRQFSLVDLSAADAINLARNLIDAAMGSLGFTMLDMVPR